MSRSVSSRQRSRIRGFESILDRIHDRATVRNNSINDRQEISDSLQSESESENIPASSCSSLTSSSRDSFSYPSSQDSIPIATNESQSEDFSPRIDLDHHTFLADIAQNHDEQYGILLVISQVFSQCNLNESTQSRIYELMKTVSRYGQEIVSYRNFKNTLNSLSTITAYKFLYCFESQGIVDYSTPTSCCTGAHGSIVVFSFIESLVNLINNNHRYLSCPHQQSAIEFTKTNLYKTLYQDIDSTTMSNSMRITLLINVDDAQMIKSSRTCTTPVSFTIAELPNYRRISKDNMFNLGIYHGDKPCPVELLWEKVLVEPFMAIQILEDRQELAYNLNPIGVDTKYGTVQVFVRIGCIIMDSVAKAKNLNIKSFMGYYGCPYCLIDGTRLVNEDNQSAVFVYPYESDSFYPPKTQQFYNSSATIAQRTGENHLGIKGKTILTKLLPVPDGIPIDYMHNILEGVFKFLMSLKPFKTKRVTKILDKQVPRVKFPHDISRKFRKITEIAYWKASECRTFLFYLIPLFRGIIDDDSLLLIHCLSTITRIFSTPYSLMSQIRFDEGKQLIDNFLTSFQSIYGQEKMRFNLHLLSHFPNQYRKMGSIIDVSAFAFENNIFRLKRSFHGTRGHVDQMSTRYVIDKGINEYQDEMNRWLSRFDPDEKLMKRKQSFHDSTSNPIGEECSFLVESNLLRRISIEIQQESIRFYSSFRIKNCVYHSLNYKFNRQSCSWAISYKVSELLFGQVLCFFTARSRSNTLQNFALIKEYHKNLRPFFVKNLKPVQSKLKSSCLTSSCNDIFYLLSITDKITFINCSKILAKIILVPSYEYPDKLWASEINAQFDHD